jgi:hypothetical protein
MILKNEELRINLSRGRERLSLRKQRKPTSRTIHQPFLCLAYQFVILNAIQSVTQLDIRFVFWLRNSVV